VVLHAGNLNVSSFISTNGDKLIVRGEVHNGSEGRVAVEPGNQITWRVGSLTLATRRPQLCFDVNASIDAATAYKAEIAGLAAQEYNLADVLWKEALARIHVRKLLPKLEYYWQLAEEREDVIDRLRNESLIDEREVLLGRFDTALLHVKAQAQTITELRRKLSRSSSAWHQSVAKLHHPKDELLVGQLKKEHARFKAIMEKDQEDMMALRAKCERYAFLEIDDALAISRLQLVRTVQACILALVCIMLFVVSCLKVGCASRRKKS